MQKYEDHLKGVFDIKSGELVIPKSEYYLFDRVIKSCI